MRKYLSCNKGQLDCHILFLRYKLEKRLRSLSHWPLWWASWQYQHQRTLPPSVKASAISQRNKYWHDTKQWHYWMHTKSNQEQECPEGHYCATVFTWILSSKNFLLSISLQYPFSSWNMFQTVLPAFSALMGISSDCWNPLLTELWVLSCSQDDIRWF